MSYTTFIGENPFKSQFKPEKPAKKAPAKKAPPKAKVMPTIEICRNEPTPETINPYLKYESIFDQLNVGDAVKVPTSQVNRVKLALEAYIIRKGIDCHARYRRDHKEVGTGYVWLLAGPSSFPKRGKKCA